MTEPLLLRPPEAAQFAGIGRHHMYELIRTGELAVIRRGRSMYVSRKAIEEWIERELGQKAAEAPEREAPRRS